MPEIIPETVLDYIKNKNLKTGFSYKDVWNEEHAAAFTVAKAMQIDVLSDLHDAVTQAVGSGQSFETFRKNIKPTLQQKGWWGRREMTDPLTGRAVDAQLGSDRRLKTIYETNMRQSFIQQKYKDIMENPLITHIMYVLGPLGPSKKHRPEHELWNGTVLPKDDPWWDNHLPQNGWHCKCDIRGISDYRLKKYEAEGVPVPPGPDGKGGGRIRIKTKAPPDNPRMFYNERKGIFEKVPSGVDPAFNCNPGKVSRSESAERTLQNAKAKYDASVKTVPAMTNRENIHKMQEAADEYFKTLAGGQKGFLNVYSRGYGKKINKILNNPGIDWTKSDMAETIRALDFILDNAPALKATTFFFKGDNALHWAGLKAGSIKPVSGFFSTSVRKSIAERYATDKLLDNKQPIMIVIRAATGSKGLYIGNKTYYPLGNEFEFLFPRSAKFRVLEKDVSHILIEVINEPKR